MLHYAHHQKSSFCSSSIDPFKFLNIESRLVITVGKGEGRMDEMLKGISGGWEIKALVVIMIRNLMLNHELHI